MVTKDNSAGLLSKMAKFVRNPTKDWSELDRPGPEPVQEGAYSKQALKEMIERKRQNDFVRRREFDQLRKLRRNEPVINPEIAGRPSFFQSSTASNPDERAITLKKIDDIEAQMSKQWWKGKQGESTVQGALPVSGRSDVTSGDSAKMIAPPIETDSGFQATQAPPLGSASNVIKSGLDYEPTKMGSSVPESAGSPVVSRRITASQGPNSRVVETGTTGFSTFKLFSVELGNDLADPELEEAAIRFANGDDVGAEEGLLAALDADNVPPDSADGWASALFDFYRATGQQASFDNVAIEYAQRFGRSAPAWFSTPDLLGQKTEDLHSYQMAMPAQRSDATWVSPVQLDLQAVQGLSTILLTAPAPWSLNWGLLGSMTPEAAQVLASMFADWCTKPVKLHFGGIDVLEKTLRSLTPSGDKGVEAYWWRLRLDALRILRLQDEFELAALDYCVTYEVSPPAWADAKCEYLHDRSGSSMSMEGSRGIFNETAPVDLSHADTEAVGLNMISAVVVELAGEVLGDAADELNKFQAGLNGSDRLVVSCARLIRVDFSAAGSILNWVANRESEGCQVQFRDVPRLVAAFFNVIGINQHAQVVLRTS